MKTLSNWVFVVLALFSNAANAATATLSVNAGAIVTTFVPNQAFGVNTIHFNFLADHQAVQAPLQAAGIKFLRYPGGSYSDVYHWNSIGNYVANVWTSNNSSFSPGFTSKAMNIGTSASGISALTDGLTTTAWVSNPDTDFPSAQWVYVDLASQQLMNQVQIWWSAPYATTFQIQYWDPAASNQWAPYLDTAPHWLNSSAGSIVGLAGQQTINFTGVSARYLRVLLQASSAPGGGYAINELKVFNSGTQLTTNVNSASQSQTTASSTTVTSAKTGPTAMGFDDFMAYCNSFSPPATPLITVNVGTGTPQEAAAWVHYANVVKGYNIKHWEIGNEMMGNWEPGGPLQAGDYGRRFIEYYNAMVAEDPSIKLVGPVSGPTDVADNWTNHTYIQDFAARLISAGMGSALGGVSVHVYAGYQNDSDAALLPSPASWVGWAASITSDIAGLPAPATLPVILSEYNANSSATNITVRLVNSLWVVNWLGQYLQAFGSRAWANFFDLIGDGAELTSTTAGSFGLFDGAPGPYQYQPFASYWGLQMMSADWAITGDTRAHSLVACSSTAAALIGYADLRPDGALSLIVINQDNVNPYTGTVQIAGFTPMALATTYSYSSANYQWQTGSVPYHASPNSPPTQSVSSGISTNFNYNFPAYSLTVFQFQPILTPSPSPTGGPISPTITPTLTPSPSQTLTPIPAATACVSKVAYNGELGAGNVNLASGNFYVTGGSTAAGEDAAALHGGAKGLDISYNWNSYWANFTFNWANYSAGNAYNLSAYDTVEFWVRCASGSLDYLYLGLDDSSGGSSPIGSVAVNSYLPGGVNPTWQRVDIPLSAFTGINKSSLWAFDLYISGLHSGSVQVYVDDFVFLQHCNTATASPSASITKTMTVSPSSSTTATPTDTPTVSGPVTSTWTPTSTGTATTTWTPTATSTGAVPTMTPTFSPSVGGTQTSTVTPTMGISLVPSPSVSATPSTTFSDSSNGPLVILEAMPWPNPNPKSLAIKLQSHCEALSLKLYSPALTLLLVLKSGPQNAGWQRWDLAPDWEQSLFSGLYFGVVEAQRGTLVSSRKVFRLLILK